MQKQSRNPFFSPYPVRFMIKNTMCLSTGGGHRTVSANIGACEKMHCLVNQFQTIRQCSKINQLYTIAKIAYFPNCEALKGLIIVLTKIFLSSVLLKNHGLLRSKRFFKSGNYRVPKTSRTALEQLLLTALVCIFKSFQVSLSFFFFVFIFFFFFLI